MRRIATFLTVPLFTIGLALPGIQTASAATPTHVGEDPYSSGCANSSYPANSGNVVDSSGHVVATVENWYSTSCITNWAVMRFSDNSKSIVDIHTPNHTLDNEGTYRQCMPDNSTCSGFYTGSASPMWTNMIEGVDQACIWAVHYTASGVLGNTIWAYPKAPENGSDAVCA